MVFHPKPHQVNECSNLVTNFALKEVDGRKFLTLTKQVLPPAFPSPGTLLVLLKQEIMSLVNNKMGPCLKVEHLQKLLKVTFICLYSSLT